MKYYMAYLYKDVANSLGVEEILGFTLANNLEEAKVSLDDLIKGSPIIAIKNLENMIMGRRSLVVGVMELIDDNELENTKEETIEEIKELKKAPFKIEQRENLLRNIQFIEQLKNK